MSLASLVIGFRITSLRHATRPLLRCIGTRAASGALQVGRIPPPSALPQSTTNLPPPSLVAIWDAVEKRIGTIQQLYNKGHRRRAIQLVFQSTIAPEHRIPYLTRVLKFLAVQQKDAHSAIPVYEALLGAGGVPPYSVTGAVMRAIVISNSNEVPFSMETLQRVLSVTPRMPSAVFHDILHIIEKIPDVDPVYIERTIEAYIRARGPGWTVPSSFYSVLVRTFAKAGNMKNAKRWLQLYQNNNVAAAAAAPPNKGTGVVSAGPFIDLLTAYAKGGKSGRPNRARISALTKIITSPPTSKGGVGSLTLPAFNILMSNQSSASLPSVLALYNLLQQFAPALLPDAFTFATIFKAHNRWKPLPRSERPKPPPRSLFRDMLRVHQYRTKGRPSLASPTITTGVLNVALRHFLQQRDYGAAIVALRTFAVCRIMPDARTHWVVSTSILERLRDELGRPRRRGVEVSWAERFLGEVLPKVEDEDGYYTQSGPKPASLSLQLADRALNAALANCPAPSHPRAHKHPPSDSSTPLPVPRTSVQLRDILRLVHNAALAEVGVSARSSAEEQAETMREVMLPVNDEMLPGRWGRGKG